LKQVKLKVANKDIKSLKAAQVPEIRIPKLGSQKPGSQKIWKPGSQKYPKPVSQKICRRLGFDPQPYTINPHNTYRSTSLIRNTPL